MLHLSTIRQHYDSGFNSVVSLVDELEQQIEALTLLNKSPSHLNHLQQTIISQQNKIKRLRQTIENNSTQLFISQQLNFQLQLRIRELEKCLVTDETSTVRKDSHNSNLPPSLDLPWQTPKESTRFFKVVWMGKSLADPVFHHFHKVP